MTAAVSDAPDTPRNDKPALVLKNVTLRRGPRCLLQAFDLELPVGEVLGVLGPNGSGKTSLLSACCAELPVAHGEIRYGDFIVTQKPTYSLALSLARIRAVLPQHSKLTFALEVKDIVQMGAYPFADADANLVNQWVLEAMSRADLHQHGRKAYHLLSGGEQQRVQFARVLVQTQAIAHTNGCAYLFLDEPTASLDLKHQTRLLSTARALANHQIAAVFIILHDLNLAARWCDKLLLMSPHGSPVLGTPDEVLREDTLRRIYDVNIHVRPHPVRSDEWLVLTDV